MLVIIQVVLQLRASIQGHPTLLLHLLHLVHLLQTLLVQTQRLLHTLQTLYLLPPLFLLHLRQTMHLLPLHPLHLHLFIVAAVFNLRLPPRLTWPCSRLPSARLHRGCEWG